MTRRWPVSRLSRIPVKGGASIPASPFSGRPHKLAPLRPQNRRRPGRGRARSRSRFATVRFAIGIEPPMLLAVGLVQTVQAPVARREVNEASVDEPARFDSALRLVLPDFFSRLLVQAVKEVVLAAEENEFLCRHGGAVDPAAGLEGPPLFAGCRVDRDHAGLVHHAEEQCFPVARQRGRSRLCAGSRALSPGKPGRSGGASAKKSHCHRCLPVSASTA